MNDELRAIREAIVRRHMAAEDAGDFEAALATFHTPRYEVTPTEEVHAGAAALRAFYAETHKAFPDFHFENTTFYHADEAVITETDFVGTHKGMYRGLPATGRSVRYRMCNVFVFDGEHLVCERLHFDMLTILKQLGIARDPTSPMGKVMVFVGHPLTTAKAFLSGSR